ncbi:hypothetical protein Ppa06_59060 [Planomonospora parontospora subsp. parontospora]|uniref:Thioredoxin domain-containing protein n=2 Tax=Planomonospora parontospora TaxID=58119 RepID=A0AA37F7F5_9ACTN|nr:hypothetical protein [Planomonospora parontospora]GGK92592.1 hypothetical protein GCM10010126_59890 [Planomonospora parontospora]GII12108.1 hypothetical protein Ppa06_59060 [Planomonospora parontospora subsp. parontospora]
MSGFVMVFAGLTGVLSVLNLLLTAALIRRLRRKGGPPAASGGPGPGTAPRVMLAGGEKTGAFRARTTRGEPVDEGFFAEGTTLFGAFAQGCGSCEERLPEFLQIAEVFPGGGEQVLVLLIGAERDLEAKRAALEPVATVVTEEMPGGPVGRALGVTGYPAMALVDPGGLVRASGTTVRDMMTAGAGV